MFKIIIHVFQKDFICVLMKYILMFKIIIHVFQMDINCINVYDHNSCISKGFYLRACCGLVKGLLRVSCGV